jgi:hypothetical protein
MDASLSKVSSMALSPADLSALTSLVREGAVTPLQAAERVASGGVLLTSDSEIFFGEVLKHGGATAANVIVDHLPMLRVGHTSASSAKYLGNLLLDYSTDPDVSRKILAWYPPFIDVPAVLTHLSIQDEHDLSFYQGLLLQFIKDVDNYRASDRVSHVLVATLEHAPEWIGKLLSALEQVQTELNLDAFLRAAAEIGVAKEALFSQLPLIGRITTQWSRVIEWIFRVYPERRMEALSKFLEQGQGDRYLMEQAFVLLAGELVPAELPAFVQLLERHRRQEDWPTKVIDELSKRFVVSHFANDRFKRKFSFYRIKSFSAGSVKITSIKWFFQSDRNIITFPLFWN